jgi:O-methyltransferase
MNKKNFMDQNWIPFSEKTDYLDLYEESLEKANDNLHDNIKKRYRFFSLYQLIVSSLTKNKDFHFVECGCFKGQSSYIIATLLKKYNFKNKFFIFDSFEGLSPYDLFDKQLKDRVIDDNEANLRRKKFVSDFENFKKLMQPFDFVEIYKGWIPINFDKIKNYQFQFVHIDVDLHRPTYDSLEFFFPRLIKGGIIVCDDYNFADFPGAKTAWDEYFKDKNYQLSYEVPLGSKFLIK